MNMFLEHLQCNRMLSGYDPFPNLVLQKQQVLRLRSPEFIFAAVVKELMAPYIHPAPPPQVIVPRAQHVSMP